MEKGLIIGVSGKARTGKDTFSEMLAEEFYNKTKTRFTLMAYAQELKLRVQRDFDLSYDQLWGDQKEVEDKRYPKPDKNSFWTAREILQAYGEFFRSIDSQFWVNNLFRVIEDKEYTNIIISDVRHPNEATPISERDGYLIKITSNRNISIHGANHISENAMDNYSPIDFHVTNNAGLVELRQSAVDVVRFIIKNEETKNGRKSKNG